MVTKLFLQRQADARHKQSLVNRKIKRLESRGVKIDGSEFDPRKDMSKMNARQLAAYSRQLASFTDRKNQFVGTRKGAPVPVSEWRAYKSAETSYNKAVKRAYDKIKDTTLPNSALTVDQFQKMVNAPNLANNYAGIDTPYRSVNRSPKNIESRKAVEALTQQLINRQDSEKVSQKSAIARQHALEGIKNSHNAGLVKRLELMPERQFKRLASYTNFMEDATLMRYPADSMGDDMRDAEAEKMDAYISWAEDSDDAIAEARHANVALTKAEAGQVRRGKR